MHHQAFVVGLKNTLYEWVKLFPFTEYIYIRFSDLNTNTARKMENKYLKSSVYKSVGHFQIC